MRAKGRCEAKIFKSVPTKLGGRFPSFLLEVVFGLALVGTFCKGEHNQGSSEKTHFK